MLRGCYVFYFYFYFALRSKIFGENVRKPTNKKIKDLTGLSLYYHFELKSQPEVDFFHFDCTKVKNLNILPIFQCFKNISYSEMNF